jgi:glycosyltransferase involved in cell wall biosynthesis
MKLSFLIPIYNGASYIDRLVASIVDQLDEYMRNEVEIVMINDGSKDNSLDVMYSLAQKYNFISCYTQENQGIGPTRNNLLCKAKGSFLWYVDQDDIVIKSSIDKVLAVADDKYDLINIGTIQVYPDGKICKRYLPDGGEEKSGLDFIEHGYRDPNPWDKILKRDFMINHHLSFGKYNGMDDFYLSFTYLSVCGRVKTVNAYGYKHILNPKSYSLINTYKVRLEWSEGSLELANDISKYIKSRPSKHQKILNIWFSVWMLGFIYSLIINKYENKYEYKMLERMQNVGLYPIVNQSISLKLRLITRVINTRLGFCLAKLIYRTY